MTNVFSNELLTIPDVVDTVTDVLSEDGYRTGGFSNNPWLGQTSGLDERFDMFFEWDLHISASPDNWEPTIWEQRYSKLHKVLGKASGQPFALLKDRFFISRALSSANRWITDGPTSQFTFVNLMGAHTPYYPTKSSFKQVGVDLPSPFELRRLNMRILKDSIHGKGIATTHSDRVREVYDASIRAQDNQLGDHGIDHIMNALHKTSPRVTVHMYRNNGTKDIEKLMNMEDGVRTAYSLCVSLSYPKEPIPGFDEINFDDE
jgi:choline-sulfatase